MLLKTTLAIGQESDSRDSIQAEGRVRGLLPPEVGRRTLPRPRSNLRSVSAHGVSLLAKSIFAQSQSSIKPDRSVAGSRVLVNQSQIARSESLRQILPGFRIV